MHTWEGDNDSAQKCWISQAKSLGTLWGRARVFSLKTAPNCMLKKCPAFLHHLPHRIPEQITDSDAKPQNTFLVPLTAQILHVPKTSQTSWPNIHRAIRELQNWALGLVWSFSLHGSSLSHWHRQNTQNGPAAVHPHWAHSSPKALHGYSTNFRKNRIWFIHFFQLREETSLMSTGFGSVPKRAEQILHEIREERWNLGTPASTSI